MTSAVNWSLESYFPEFNGSAMNEFKEKLKTDIEKLFNHAEAIESVNSLNQQIWEQVLLDFEELLTRISHLSSYIGCLSAADSQNEDYNKATGELAKISAEFSKIGIQIMMGLKACNDSDFNDLIKRDKLREISFKLQETRKIAKKSMSKELETLAADLGVDGFNAWGRLYNTIVGKLKFEMLWPDGTSEMKPIGQCRSIMTNADRRIRKAAFVQGNKKWESIEDICAAILNAISGNRLLLNRKRGYESFLEVPITQSRISKKTLDSMFQAIEESSEFVQRVGKAKARALGQEKLAWYDYAASLKIPSLKEYSWDEATQMVGSGFQRSYPELGQFFSDTLNKRWVESEARSGKRPGAFCTGSLLTEESRIYMTFAGSLRDIFTLAHETGHAFHSHVMKGLRPHQKSYPMTLAETASIFAEMLLAEGLLADPDSSDAIKLNIVNANLNRSMAFLIDIPIRFYFEKAYHEERLKGEISVSRFKELMVTATKNQFGDLLEEDGANQFFWIEKMHFYVTGRTFYNFPYTFGYLLSRGLYAEFKKDAKGFLPKYREFLNLSGSDMAHNIASKTIGADLEKTDFWKQAILSLENDLKLFEELVPKVIK